MGVLKVMDDLRVHWLLNCFKYGFMICFVFFTLTPGFAFLNILI